MVPPRRGQQLVGFRKRRMAPRPSKPSPRLSRPSLRPAMAPPWPARPWTAVLWLPKATDGTSAFKTLAALRPAMAPPWPARPWTAVLWLPKATDGTSAFKTLAGQGLDRSSMASETDAWHLALQKPRRASAGPVFVQHWPWTAVLWLPKATDGTSAFKSLAAPQPAQSSSSNGASVASQALDSSSMASESDGWHLGLQNPRRASAGPVQFYGFRKRRMAPRPSKPSPRPSLRPAMAPPWPARPWTAVLWLPKATDGTSAFKTLAALQPAQSRRAPAGPVFVQLWRLRGQPSPGWHLGLQKPRRASAGPVFVQQWRLRGQPGPGQEFYGFRKRRMAPRPSKASPRLSRPSLRPAMAPPWPAMPWTAVLWLPKATDGTSAFKTLAAPQPAHSSSSHGASVASQALDSSSPAMAPPSPAKPRTAVLWLPKATDGTSGFKTLAAPDSDGWHLGLENPRRASAGPVFVQQWWRLRGQPSPGYMASESNGWHLGLANPRRARSDGWHLGLRGQPRPCQHFYGFRKRRMAPRAWKPSPRLRPTVATVARLAHHML